MDGVLLVTSSDREAEGLALFLKESGHSLSVSARSGSEARRLMSERDFELVVINTPLSDEFGTSLALKATESTAGVVVIVRASVAPQVEEKLENYGVYVIEKPIHKPFFYRAVKMAVTMNKRLIGARAENEILKDKIETIRLVDRAKLILVQHLSFTEEEAHRFIEKQAMNMRESKKTVAEGIIKTYEN